MAWLGLGSRGGGGGAALRSTVNAFGCIVINSAPPGTTEIWYQPWADAANNATNRTYVAYTGPGQQICGLTPAERRVGAVGAFATALNNPYPWLIWSDDFQSYANTAAMLAGGWIDTSTGGGSVVLDAGQMSMLVGSANTAQAVRIIGGYNIGDVIRATYTLAGTASFNEVSFRNLADSIIFASGTATVGTHQFSYATTTGSMLFKLRRSNANNPSLYADNIIIENLGPL